MTKPAQKIKNKKPIFVLVIPRFDDLSNSFYAGEVTKGANIAASRLGVDILVHLVDRADHSRWLEGLLDPFFIDGILFADIDRDWEVVKGSIRRGMPTLVLNNANPEPYNTISIDNRAAARQAVVYLAGLGHVRIATIAGDLHTQSGQDRLEGYHEGMAAAGLSVLKKWIKPGHYLRSGAHAAAQALLKESDPKQRPSAIFAASDVMAYEAIAVAAASGLSVPKDLSIIGFDNNLEAGVHGMALTTFEQPLVDMARQGIESLYQMSMGLARLPVKLMLEARMIKGRSVIAVKDAA